MEEEIENLNSQGSVRSKSKTKSIAEILLVIRDRWLLALSLALPISLGYVYLKFQDARAVSVKESVGSRWVDPEFRLASHFRVKPASLVGDFNEYLRRQGITAGVFCQILG